MQSTSITKETIKDKVISTLEPDLERLEVIWNEIGIEDAQRSERTQVVEDHLRNILDKMVAEENDLKTKLLRSVQTCGDDLLQLSNDLHVLPFQPEDGLTLLQLEWVMRSKRDDLNAIKQRRLLRLKKLKEKDRQLSEKLGTTPYYMSPCPVPTEEQLEVFQLHVDDATSEQKRRFATFLATKNDISNILDDLEETPNTTFERDVVCEDDDSFILSGDNMTALAAFHQELITRKEKHLAHMSELREKLDSLWGRLAIPAGEREEFLAVNSGCKPSVMKALNNEIARCEELKLLNMKQFIAQMRSELAEWWEKCFFSEVQRSAFKEFYSDDCTEELLEKHEVEVKQMKELYARHEKLFAGVQKRMDLWHKFQEFEEKASDPNRFYDNRGGKLLQEEKDRKQLMHALPKLESKLEKLISIWEQENGEDFVVDGVKFGDFIRSQWESYWASKEQIKQERRRARVKEAEEEAVYGSNPSTPRKRFHSPSKTPSKMRKVNYGSPLKVEKRPPLPKTPSSAHKRTTPMNSAGSHRSRRAFRDRQLPLSSSPINKAKSDGTIMSVASSAVGYMEFTKGLKRDSKEYFQSSTIQNSNALSRKHP